jgi:hypothetical protein
MFILNSSLLHWDQRDSSQEGRDAQLDASSITSNRLIDRSSAMQKLNYAPLDTRLNRGK